MRLLGLDLGATGAHAVAVDETGRIVTSASLGYATQTPRPGWIEQDPADWWRAATHVVAQVAMEANGEIGALGLTGQHGTVFVDARGEPVRAAILDSDRRAALQATYVRQRLGAQRLIELCGSPALPGHQAPAVLWLRDVEPVQYRHTHRALLPKDYVRLLLTGEAATEPADAAGTLLLDLRRRRWSEEMLDALEIPAAWMPPLHESLEIAGGLRPSLAHELGLPAGLPVATGAGTVAAMAVSTGLASGTVGSSIDRRGLLFTPINGALVDPGGRLQTACSPVPHQYHVTGMIPSAGGSLRWWRDILGGRFGHEELVELAESVAPGANGLFFVPHVDGDLARGAFVGLRSHHTQADLTRAILEGVVFSLRNRLDVMRGLGVEPHQVRATGGGARSRLWRQMQADIFALPVAAMAGAPSPALGAALLAGLAAGVFSDLPGAAAAAARIDHVLEPDPERAARYEPLYRTFTALDPAIWQPSAPRPT